MNRLDILDRGIRELRGLLSQGWRDIASGNLTAYERCEIREQMTKTAVDLRLCLQAHAEEARRLQQLAQPSSGGAQSITLRFLNTDYDMGIAPRPPLAGPAEAKRDQVVETAS